MRLNVMSARRTARIRRKKEKGKVAGEEKAKAKAKVKENAKEKVDEKAEEKDPRDVDGALGRKETPNVHSLGPVGMPTTKVAKSFTLARCPTRRNT